MLYEKWQIIRINTYKQTVRNKRAIRVNEKD